MLQSKETQFYWALKVWKNYVFIQHAGRGGRRAPAVVHSNGCLALVLPEAQIASLDSIQSTEHFIHEESNDKISLTSYFDVR